jgi:hypothetical protein
MNKWLKESEEALVRAIEISDNGDVPLKNLYLLAPIIYSERNKTNNDRLFNLQTEESEQQVKADCKVDPKSIEQYKFHFVSSYLLGYVVYDKIDEMKYDRIMEYVSQKMDLFSSDYGDE